MPSISSFEKEFNKDIQNKKRIARGVHSMKGKRGYVGKLLTTMDLLTGKEKRDYIKAGEIIVSNVYKQLIPLDELLTYTPETQKKIMENWRENHTQKEILEGVGINKSQYYRYLSDLNIIDRPNWLGGNNKEPKPFIPPNNKKSKNIIPLQEFKRLPLVDQYKTLDNYYNYFTAREIGEIWGKNQSMVHQLRYTIKKKLKNKGLYDKLQKEENKAVAVTPTEKEKDQLKLDDLEDNTTRYKGDTYNSNIDLPKQEKSQSEGDIESVSDIKNLLEYIQNSFSQQIEKQSDSLSELRQDIDKIKDDTPTRGGVSFINSDRFRVDDGGKMKLTPNNSSMNLHFQDEKEGFLLHAEIEKFISVLKKNPDTFKINISLTKIDE